MTAGLIMDAPTSLGLRAGPSQPTLIFPDLRKRPQQFESVAAVARYIHRERLGRGLQLTASSASYDGSDSFPILRLCWLNPNGNGGEPEYAFAIAIQGRSREAFEAVIAAKNPEIPAAFRLRA